jgi:hypothetical protein
MVVNTRDDIKNFVLSIESKLPVNDWTFDGVHIWPFIRLQLFFYLRKQTYESQDKKDANPAARVNNNSEVVRNNRYAGFIKKIRSAFFYYRWRSKIKPKKYVFTAHNTHRINYKDVFYNRFFDTIIDENQLKMKSCFIEFGSRKRQELANSEIVIQVDDILRSYTDYYYLKKILFRKRDTSFNLQAYQLFLDLLTENGVSKDFTNKFSIKNLQSILDTKYQVEIQFYLELFDKIKPQKLICLCYYTDISMIAAANKLGIETVEMQHGAQTPAHLAYGRWSVVPPHGYDFLPRSYWSWDEYSKNAINEWAGNNKLYKTFVGGNVWVDYWNSKTDTYNYNNFILYTLQPDSLRLDELFTVQIVALIKSGKYNWFIRLHPRQLNKINEIKEYLEKNDILKMVNIEQATKDPLPVLLKNCLVHVTNSSASTIEAALFNKKTLLLHEIGKLYYSDLIDEGIACFVPMDTNFESCFEKVIFEEKSKILNKTSSMFYKTYFHN